MLDVAGAGHLGGDVDHCGDDFLRQGSLQPLGIVDAVLQA